VAPSVSEAVDAAIASGMAKPPQDRPASAGEFARNLLVASRLPAEASRPVEVTAAAKPRRFVSRPAVIGLVVLAGVTCLAGIGLLGGGLAAFFVSSTPVAPATRTVSVATAFAPTETTAGPALPIGDDFSDPSSGFATDPEGHVAYVDGELEIKIDTPGNEWFSPYQGLEEQDLSIQVEARQVEGPTGSEMGIVCRWLDDRNYVAAAVRGDGMVSIWRKTDDVVERWQDWTPMPLPAGSATDWRTLQLTCAGNEIRFAVDGTQVATATDPQPKPGSLALMAGLLEPGDLLVAFDRLAVRRP
jgi:hypothetical protein